MKKTVHLILLAILLVFAGCSEINDRLDSLEGRVDVIENTEIATITQQIDAINNSIMLLNDADKELKGYIEALEKQAAELESQLSETNAKIDQVTTELRQQLNEANGELEEEIAIEKANILAELEAFKSQVNAELVSIKATIAELKSKDVALESQIVQLEEHVDAELNGTKEWAAATFATLEQYNSIVASITAIEGMIDGVNQSLAALETRINEKIAADIAAASAVLSADLQQAVTEITAAYASAIASAKEEITAAYTASLSSAIATLESSMKQWVNDRLTAYCTIADTEAKISILQSEIDGKLSAQKAYIEALISSLSSDFSTQISALQKQIDEINKAIAANAKEVTELKADLVKQQEEITEAYTAAIAQAIEESEGKIQQELANEIAAINDRIEASDVAAIEAYVKASEERFLRLEEDVNRLKVDVLKLQGITEKLLAQIQSISYIPTHEDGKVTVDYKSKQATLDFTVSPKSAIADLAKVWKTALSFKAVATQSRAVTFIDLPITNLEADTIQGTITITIDGSNLGEDFFAEKSSASASLAVSDGNNSINSAYLNLTSNFIIHFEDLEAERICVLKWDTDGDGCLSYEEAAAVTDIGSEFSNSTIYTFDEFKYFTGVTKIAYFNKCSNLVRISLPPNLRTISSKAFEECTSLHGIIVPEHVDTIGARAFYGCTKLSMANISGSVNAIGESAFENSGLRSFIISKGITVIEDRTFYGCKSLSNVVIPESVTQIGVEAFYNCTSLKGNIILDNVEKIGKYAFYSTKNEEVRIGKHIKSIGTYAFSRSVEDSICLYIKAPNPPTFGAYIFGTRRPSSNVVVSGRKIVYVPQDALDDYSERWKVNSQTRGAIYGYDFENE